MGMMELGGYTYLDLKHPLEQWMVDFLFRVGLPTDVAFVHENEVYVNGIRIASE